MPFDALKHSIESVPPGAWAVGVSGGIDSVALLSLLKNRPDLSLHVIHLDHQTRGEESTGDAEFVGALCRQWHLPHTLARREEIEPLAGELPANISARYRAIRLCLFKRTIDAQHLDGLILAHHADDQAETILLRLLRGSSEAGLTGMRPVANLCDMIVLRPLLNIRRSSLQEYLRSIGQSWREDSSNASDRYQRNRLRQWLAGQTNLVESLLATAQAMQVLHDWQQSAAPVLPNEFSRKQLAELPRVLAEPAARRWLVEQGVPPDELTLATVNRLLLLASDSSQPPRQHFPGGVLIRRSHGWIGCADSHLAPKRSYLP